MKNFIFDFEKIDKQISNIKQTIGQIIGTLDFASVPKDTFFSRKAFSTEGTKSSST